MGGGLPALVSAKSVQRHAERDEQGVVGWIKKTGDRGQYPRTSREMDEIAGKVPQRNGRGYPSFAG